MNKILKSFFGLFLGAAFSLGVAASINANKSTNVEKAEATATYDGSICFEFQYISEWNYYWDDANAKIACLIKDGSTKIWTSLVKGNGSHHLEIPYSLSFDPFGKTMDLYRFASSVTSPYEGNQGGDIWAKISNSGFGQIVYIYGSGNGSSSAVHTNPTFMGFNSFGSSDQIINRLSYSKYNDSGKFEFYRTGMTLQQGDYGKVALDGSEWCNATHDVPTEYFWIDYEHYENNLVCQYYGDSYDVYFNVNDKNSYISIPDRAVAEKWGNTFLGAITCTGTTPGSVTSPDTAWNTTMKNAYLELTTDQQGKVWTASANPTGTYLEQAVYRYDFILSKYGTSKYENFVNRSIPKSGRIALFGSVMEPNTTGIVTIVVISSLGLLSFGAYYFFRKSRKAEE